MMQASEGQMMEQEAAVVDLMMKERKSAEEVAGQMIGEHAG